MLRLRITRSQQIAAADSNEERLPVTWSVQLRCAPLSSRRCALHAACTRSTAEAWVSSRSNPSFAKFKEKAQEKQLGFTRNLHLCFLIKAVTLPKMFHHRSTTVRACLSLTILLNRSHLGTALVFLTKALLCCTCFTKRSGRKGTGRTSGASPPVTVDAPGFSLHGLVLQLGASKSTCSQLVPKCLSH